MQAEQLNAQERNALQTEQQDSYNPYLDVL